MSHQGTIFYVDDNPRSRRLISSIFKVYGFEVITSGDPVEAVSRMRSLSFDVALLDYQMPHLTGAQVAQRIKTARPGMPVVMISGYPSLPPSELLFVDAYVGRGASIDDLLDTVRRLLPPDAAPVMARKLHPLPSAPHRDTADMDRAVHAGSA
jgi:CheY-like chemotaxis protein